MDQIGGMLQQYTGASGAEPPQNVHNDFDQVVQAAPQSTLANGLAAAFQSNQTPPFGQMVGQLFGQSNNQQRAGILNTLIAAAGPAILSQVLQGRGGSGLGGLLGGGQSQVTPEQAAQIPPDAVEQIASQAEQKDPSVIDRASEFYAQHPTLVKTIGGGALAIALAKIAQNQSGGG
jgi:hypothetical protein